MGYVVNFFDLLLTALLFAIIGRVVLSWIDPAGRWAISRIILEITEPIIRPIRRIMPQTGTVDFSPMIAMLLISLLQRILEGVTR